MAFNMDQHLSAPDRVRAALSVAGVAPRIREFGVSTRTAQEAADAIGTSVGQIVKSLVFMAGDAPVLALVSGANQLDLARLGASTGTAISRADANAVRQATGFAIAACHRSVLRRPSRPTSIATCCSTTSSGPRQALPGTSFRSRRRSSS